MNLLLWGGPVSTAMADGVAWQSPTQVLTINHGPPGADGNTIGSNAFSNLAASVRTPSGSVLDGLLAAHGLRADSFDRIAIAGFSAFHGLANPLLAADGDRIAAAVLLDSCFSSFGSVEKAGYVDFAARAARGEKLMVFSSSHGGGGTYTTGSVCAIANFDAGAARAGVAPQAWDPSPLPRPSVGRTERAGDLYLLDYGPDYQHAQHVTSIGKPILSTLLAPYLAHGSLDRPADEVATDAPPRSGSSWLPAVGVVVAGLAAGYYFATKSRSRLQVTDLRLPPDSEGPASRPPPTFPSESAPSGCGP